MSLLPYSASLPAILILGTGTATSISLGELPPEIETSVSYRPLNMIDKADSLYQIESQKFTEEMDKIRALQGFSKELIINSKPLDAEILEVINESFWNLL